MLTTRVWETSDERARKVTRAKTRALEPRLGYPGIQQTLVWTMSVEIHTHNKQGLNFTGAVINYSKTGKNRSVAPPRSAPPVRPPRPLPVEIEIGLIGGRSETPH